MASSSSMSQQVVITEPREIRRMLNRLRLEELQKLTFRWGVNLPDNTTKMDAVRLLLEGKLAGGMNHRQYAEMDITQCIAQPSMKSWTACKLARLQDEGASVPTVKPAELEAALNRELDMYYKQYTAVRNVGGVTWARIGIEEERWRTNSQMQVIFVVHHARSHFIFHSQAKKNQLPYIFAAVRNAFRCAEVESMDLAGRDLVSLSKMCLETQGRYSSASLAHTAGGPKNPLQPAPSNAAQAASKKRQRQEERTPGDRTTVLDEDGSAKRKRKVALVDVFGVDKLPPALSSVDFKVKGGYKGSYTVPGNFQMHVRFEGPNVVAGFRDLVEAGMADLPLPAHIASLPETMQSTIDVDA